MTIIVPRCPICSAQMQFSERRHILICPACGLHRAAKSWYSDQGETLNVAFAKRGPEKIYRAKFIFQCTEVQHAQILERGGAEYLRRLIEADNEVSPP